MLKVRLLASLSEKAGWSSQDVAIPEGVVPTPAGLWVDLGLGDTPPPFIRVAVNHSFADWHLPLESGDEVAFLPPMTGG